ncbi:LapA family protein [Streptomyces sp. ZYX-F-203]
MSRADRAGRASRSRARASGRRRPELTASRITALVLIALAIVLIAQNTESVEIRLIVPIVTMPLYLALLLMFVIGGLCGALLLRLRDR